MSVTRRAAVVAALAALALSGCAQASDASPSPSETQASPIETAQPGSKVDVAPLTEAVQQAAADETTFHVKLRETTTGKEDVAIEGDMDRTEPDSPRMQMKTTQGAQTTEVILVDGSGYQSTDGETWTRTSDTARILQYLAQQEVVLQYADTAHYDGAETIGSTPTAMYTLKLTLPNFNGTTSMKIWVDAKHQIRKYELTAKAADETDQYTGTISKINEKVSIEAPAVG